MVIQPHEAHNFQLMLCQSNLNPSFPCFLHIATDFWVHTVCYSDSLWRESLRRMVVELKMKLRITKQHQNTWTRKHWKINIGMAVLFWKSVDV